MSREDRKKRWGVFETFVIGKQDNPMMKRVRLLQTPWFGLYVHFIYREDLDPVPHDHPWNFWRLVIRGGYLEHYLTKPATGKYRLTSPGRWRPSYVPTTHAHRIVTVAPGTVSLVLVGKKQRVWGFWTPEALPLRKIARGRNHPEGPGPGTSPERTWIDYRDALNLRPSEGVRGQDRAYQS